MHLHLHMTGVFCTDPGETPDTFGLHLTHGFSSLPISTGKVPLEPSGMMTAHYIRFSKSWQACIFEGGWAYRLLLTTLCLLPETAVIKASRRPLTPHVTKSGTRIDSGKMERISSGLRGSISSTISTHMCIAVSRHIRACHQIDKEEVDFKREI